MFWTWLDKGDREPSTPMKMMFGMLLTGLAFLVLNFASTAGGFTKPVAPVLESDATGSYIAISPEAREYLKVTALPVKKIDGKDVWRVNAPNVEKGEFLRLENPTGPTIAVAPTSRVSALWLVLAYFILSLGELMLSPMGLSLVSKVAPIRMRGLMMGGWFAATAIGNKLTGIAEYWDLWSHSFFFLIIASLAFVMAVVLLLLLRPLKKAMPGV
jgi:dipeptide/tripeptide permease